MHHEILHGVVQGVDGEVAAQHIFFKSAVDVVAQNHAGGRLRGVDMSIAPGQAFDNFDVVAGQCAKG